MFVFFLGLLSQAYTQAAQKRQIQITSYSGQNHVISGKHFHHSDPFDLAVEFIPSQTEMCGN